MKKIGIAILVALTAGVLWAQETEQTQTQALIQTMTQELAQLGWGDPELAAFERACEQYAWGTDVDPQALALVLRYANRDRTTDEPLGPQAQAQFMYAVATELQTMARIGLDDRETAVAVAKATRTALRSMNGDEIASAGGGDRLRTRLRENEPTGSAMRYGEDTLPGAPPASPPTNDTPRGPRN